MNRNGKWAAWQNLLPKKVKVESIPEPVKPKAVQPVVDVKPEPVVEPDSIDFKPVELAPLEEKPQVKKLKKKE